MATIEHCDFLNPLLKARLQDNGILYVSALYSLLGPVRNVSSEERLTRLRSALPFLSAAESNQLLDCILDRQRHAGTLASSLSSTPTAWATSPLRVRSLAEVLAHSHTTFTNTDVAGEHIACSPGSLPFSRTRITTFCRALDELLGGGVPTNTVTELSGPPGVGKTQLMLQLAVSCVLPCEFGGLDASCLYVDTEGSFSAERLRQLMVSAVSVVRMVSASTAPVSSLNLKRHREGDDTALERGSSSAVVRENQSDHEHGVEGAAESVAPLPFSALTERFTVEDALERVQYVRCTELSDVVALLHTVELYKRTRVPDLGMLLIDSIAFPFRAFQESSGQSVDATNSTGTRPSASSTITSTFSHRYRPLLFTCSQLLQQLAANLSLTVIVSNHVTTRTVFLAPASNGESAKTGASTPRDRLPSRAHAWQSSSASANAIPTPHWTSETGRAVSTTTGTRPVALPTADMPQRTSVLIPALGEAWSAGIETRVLLSFHHYGTSPSAAGSLPAGCREDLVVHTSRALVDAEGVVRQYESLVQHRVARVLCIPTGKRAECCFAITRKGIRDLPRPQN